MDKRKVTVYDLAKEAGVSTATISRVINNSPNVDFQTRLKIQELFRKHNYRPKIVKDSALSIVIIVDKMEDPGAALSEYISGIFAGALTYANKRAVSLSILPFDFNSLRHPQDLISYLLEKGYVGAVFLNPEVNAEYISELNRIDFPFVTIGSFFSNKEINSLNIDNREGIRIAINYLKDKGHEKIGYIAVDHNQFDSIERLDAFQSYMADHYNEMHVINAKQKAGDHKKTTYDYMMHCLPKMCKDDLPSAFVCLNDDVAIAAIKALVENGYRVPEDISIVGFDNYSYSEYTVPSLTTIENPLLEIGSLACSIVDEALSGSRSTVRRHFIPGLVERSSCIDRSAKT